MTQLLIKAEADIEVRGWLTQSEESIQISPQELIQSWISKSGFKFRLGFLKSIVQEKIYVKTKSMGN
jgi:hypothetical protein